MKTLVVLTAGQTDVQLVSEGRRKEFDGNQCGKLHSEIERREADWQIVDAPKDKDDTTKVKEMPPGSFDLCTPKLDAVLDYLAGEGLTVTHSLILETQRDAQKEKKDPRMAGRILERRVKQRLPQAAVRRESYLSDGERLEGNSDPRDRVIRRDVVARIDQAVARSISEFRPQRIVVASTGGIPSVCELVEEVVRCHASGGITVESLEVPDGAKADPPGPDRAVPKLSAPSPAEVFRAKRHALELIEQGNLLAAWGAVRHLRNDDGEHRWTRVVEWLYCFAASLPLPEECDIDLLRDLSVGPRAALRVELALRAGDIPRAVHGTVSFFEAAAWHHLGKHVKRHDENSRLFRVDPAPPEDLTGNNRAFELDQNVDGGPWYRIHDQHKNLVKIAKHYLERPKLEELGRALSDEVRHLRNDVAHNEPTRELMAEASRIMERHGLWSTNGFLAQPLVRGVLEELGVQAPETLCDRFISEVRRRLAEPPQNGAQEGAG